jgi:hypothetical protein
MKHSNPDKKEIVRIPSENPEKDLWIQLLQYSYPANIKRTIKSKNPDTTEITDDLIELISGSMIQAEEYQRASHNVSIHTSPLLLYYSIINLTFAVSCLIKGDTISVDDHGMRLTKKPDKNGHLADVTIQVVNENTGALSSFAKVISPQEIKSFCDAPAL